MALSIDIPEKKTMIPKIKVLGVGGAGGNAINNMIKLNLQGVDFAVANTDAQALSNSKAQVKIQLGENITKGLGAGSSPEVGAKAAEESKNEIVSALEDANMVFITAGMGGGTGTGAAPVIARMCRELGILTVGVITKPFHFEGSFRMGSAENGVDAMQKSVDTLITIPNQNLFHKATEQTTFAEAFHMVDDVLYSGIKGITDLMTMPGLINLDFADIRTIMGNMGKAMMGTGESAGDKRALDAAEAAISNPLLDNTSMKGAKGVLINIAGGLDMTLFEADEAAQRIKDEVDPDANIIFGSTFDNELGDKVRVSVVATGIDSVVIMQENDSLFNRTVNTQVNQASKQEEDERESVVKNSGFVPIQAVKPEMLVNENKAVQKNEEMEVFEEDAVKNYELAEEDEEILLDSGLVVAEEDEDVLVTQTSEKISSDVSNILRQTPGGGGEKKIEQSLDDVVDNSSDEADINENTNRSAKSSGLKGFFGFFKPVDKKDKEKEVSNTQEGFENDNKEARLAVGDDVLDIPTFVRNKNE